MPPKRPVPFSPIDTLDRNPSKDITYGSNKKPRYDQDIYHRSNPERYSGRYNTSQKQDTKTELHEPIDIAKSPKEVRRDGLTSSTSSNLRLKGNNGAAHGTQENSRQTTSITSLGNFSKKGEKITPLGSKNEFAALDSMMKPGSRSKKRRKISDVNGNDLNFLTNTPPMTDVANSFDHSYEAGHSPIDLEQYSDSPQGRRTRTPVRANGMLAQRGTVNSVEEIQDPDIGSDRAPHMLREYRAPFRQQNLRNSFKRDRGSMNDDVDELQQDQPTVSALGTLVQRSAVGKNRQFKVPRSLADIIPTQFYASAPTRRGRALSGRQSRESPTEISPPPKQMYVAKGFKNAIPLSVFDNLEITLENERLELVVDRINSGFFVYLNGEKKSEICRNHIQNVQVGEQLRRFRLLGPMGDKNAPIECHLKFRDGEAGGAFLHELEKFMGSSTKRDDKSEEQLVRMRERFLKKRIELRERQDRILAEKLEEEERSRALSSRRVELRNPIQTPRNDQGSANSALDNILDDLPSPKTRTVSVRKENGIVYDFPDLASENNNSEPRATRSNQKTYGRTSGLRKNPGDPVAIEKAPFKHSVVNGLGKPWKKPLVFPRDGPNKTTVEFSDLPRLDDGEFLNDNLISFWLRYSQKCHSELDSDVYFFNTFFYSSLTKAVKGKKGINYDLVKRWTSKVDLFNYDYVVVPINEHVHWYVAIICNLRNLGRNLDDDNNSEHSTHQDEPLEILSEGPDMDENDNSVHQKTGATEMLTEKTSLLSLDASDLAPIDLEASTSQSFSTSPKRSKKRRVVPLRKLNPHAPVIITLDSFGFGHSPVVRNLKDYLQEEGKAKRNMDVEIVQNGVTAKGIPQQQNYYDCGLYVLFYLARFLQGPQSFIRKILLRELSIEDDWPHVSSSDIRTAMRNTIQSEYQKQNPKSPGGGSLPPSSQETSEGCSVMDILTGNKSKESKKICQQHEESSEPLGIHPQSGSPPEPTENSGATTATKTTNEELSRQTSPIELRAESNNLLKPIDALLEQLGSEKSIPPYNDTPNAAFLAHLAATALAPISHTEPQVSVSPSARHASHTSSSPAQRSHD